MNFLFVVFLMSISFSQTSNYFPFDWGGQFGYLNNKGKIFWNQDWRSNKLLFDGTWAIYPKMFGKKIEDGFKPKDLNAMLKLLEKSGVQIFHPLAAHAMNKCFENKDPLCEWTAKYTNKPLIINGNIKSPQLLEEAATLCCADWYAMDQSIFERLQWYEFLERKINP